MAEIATSLLAEHGHAITHVLSADEALRRLQSGLTFDLVFSDLVMPGELDGLDLARTIRARWPALPVLLVTGYSDVANRAAGEGFPLLNKPYRPDALTNAIQQVTAAGAQSASSGSNVIPLPVSAK